MDLVHCIFAKFHNASQSCLEKSSCERNSGLFEEGLSFCPNLKVGNLVDSVEQSFCCDHQFSEKACCAPILQDDGSAFVDAVHAGEHRALAAGARGVGAPARGDRLAAAPLRQRHVEPVQQRQQLLQRQTQRGE